MAKVESTVRIEHTVRAWPGVTFGPEFAASWVGKTVRLSMPDEPESECTVVAAQAAEDGQSISLTVEVPIQFEAEAL